MAASKHLKAGAPVYVEAIFWRDAFSPPAGWLPIQDNARLKLPVCLTIGIVVHEDDDRILHAGTITDDGDESEVGAIPKAWILERRRAFALPEQFARIVNRGRHAKMRKTTGNLQPRCRILPPGQPVEPGQAGGVPPTKALSPRRRK